MMVGFCKEEDVPSMNSLTDEMGCSSVVLRSTYLGLP